VLEPWLDRTQRRSSSAIGHSTGPILLSHFLPLVTASSGHHQEPQLPRPGDRVDDFFTMSHRASVRARRSEQLRVFDGDEAEQADNVAKVTARCCTTSRACEGKEEVPILGLEHCLYENAATRQLFGLASHAGAVRAPVPANPQALATVEFSQVEHGFPPNDLTQSRQHGYFDNDAFTMNTVLLGILGRATLAGIPGSRIFPSDEEFDKGEALDDLASRALGDEPLERNAVALPRQHEQGAATTGRGDPEPTTTPMPTSGWGRRRAGRLAMARSSSPDRAGASR
jgi:hypothetical protein